MSEIELHFYYFAIDHHEDVVGLIETTTYMDGIFHVLSSCIRCQQVSYAEYGTMLAIETDLPVYKIPKMKTILGCYEPKYPSESPVFLKMIGEISQLCPKCSDVKEGTDTFPALT